MKRLSMNQIAQQQILDNRKKSLYYNMKWYGIKRKRITSWVYRGVGLSNAKKPIHIFGDEYTWLFFKWVWSEKYISKNLYYMFNFLKKYKFDLDGWPLDENGHRGEIL